MSACGMDSFGSSALIGQLNPKFHCMKLTPLQIYDMETVADLVNAINKQLGIGGETESDRKTQRKSFSV